MYDATRLLVAYTNESDTCRTPHFMSDLLVALKDEETSLKRLSVVNGVEADLVVNGSNVQVRGMIEKRTFSVRYGDKFVLASCARTALVPISVMGTSLLTLFTGKYAEGNSLFDLDNELSPFHLSMSDVQWGYVSYLEVAPIVDAIRMLIPETSVS